MRPYVTPRPTLLSANASFRMTEGMYATLPTAMPEETLSIALPGGPTVTAVRTRPRTSGRTKDDVWEEAAHTLLEWLKDVT